MKVFYCCRWSSLSWTWTYTVPQKQVYSWPATQFRSTSIIRFIKKLFTFLFLVFMLLESLHWSDNGLPFITSILFCDNRWVQYCPEQLWHTDKLWGYYRYVLPKRHLFWRLKPALLTLIFFITRQNTETMMKEHISQGSSLMRSVWHYLIQNPYGSGPMYCWTRIHSHVSNCKFYMV